MISISIITADLNNPVHAALTLELLNNYACDPMGGGTPLSEFCRANLIAELRKRAGIHVLLAYANDVAAGLSICIEGFSTFACKPLLNIHDIAVNADFRGQGVAKKLIFYIEQLAQELGCCKITLEVLHGNSTARAAYLASGFQQYQLDPAAGGAILMQKHLLPL